MLTEKLSRKRKLFAALLMTAGLTTVISALGIPAAAERVVPKGAACCAGELQGAMLPLELGKALDQGKVIPLPKGKLLDLGGPKTSCAFTGLRAMLGADNLFLVSYSFLNFFLFQFLVGSRRLRPAFFWCLAGTVLSVVMLVSDALENWALYQWIDHFPAPPSSFLNPATSSKWTALALAALFCGVAYLFQRPPLLKLLILPAALCAGLFAVGVYDPNVDQVKFIKMGVLFLNVLWGCGLLHAIAVILQPALPTEPSHV